MKTIKRYSVSIVTQGDHKFYTCTVPSDVLAKCCYVTTREEDPVEGFQRLLDKKRALDIARYIDEEKGTIPSSIILSAQPDAELMLVGQSKTLQFTMNPKAFLVLDGQHRVYGFSLAQSNLRVPVVIYSGLSRRDETRLFIDINSKQKGVPSELLFDIKKLADYENSVEERMREVYDLFHAKHHSAMLGLTSPSSKSSGKVSRATFNSAVKPLLELFEGKDSLEFFELVNAYLIAFKTGLDELEVGDYFTNNIVFRAILSFFPTAAAKVKDRHGSDYSVDNFYDVLKPVFEATKPSRISSPGSSYKALADTFLAAMKTRFRL